MSDSAIVLSVVGAYLVACLAVGMLPGRRSSDSAAGFVAGDRSLGLLVTYFITGATIFSSFAFLGMAGWAWSRGSAAFYVLGYGTLGFVPFYFLGPRAARVGRRYGFVTQAEMAARRYGTPLLAGVMSLVTLLALVPYLAIQMKGAGIVLRELSGGALSQDVGGALVYAIVLVYVLRSGVLGVGWTNTLQGTFMMVLAWTLGLYLPRAMYGGVGPMIERILAERPELLDGPGLASDGTPWPWAQYYGAAVLSVLGFSMWPQVFMRAFSARSEETLRRTVVLYPTFQLFLVPLILLAFAAVPFEPAPEVADNVLPHLLLNVDVHPLVVGLFCAGALAASMSSGDAMLHTAASSLVRDGWVTALGRTLTPHEERRWIRVLIVLVALIAYVTAVRSEGSLVRLLLFAYGPITQFAPGVTCALYWPRARGSGVLAGMVAGTLVTLVVGGHTVHGPFAGLYGLAANVAVLVALSLRAAPTREAREFVRVAAGDSGGEAVE